MVNHGRRRQRQRRPRPKINLMRCPITQRLVRLFGVVEHEIIGKMGPGRRDRLVIVKINLLVLDRPPDPFDKDAVINPAAAVHADPDPRAFQKPREFGAGELRPLVGIENLRLPLAKGRPECLQAEVLFQRRRKRPRNHRPAGHIDDCHQVDEPVAQPNVRYIAAPDLVGPHDRQTAEKVRIDLVLAARNTQPRLPANDRKSQFLHQPADPFPIDPKSPLLQLDAKLPRSEKGPGRKFLGQDRPQNLVLRILRKRLIIERRSAQIQKLALSDNRDARDARARFLPACSGQELLKFF